MGPHPVRQADPGSPGIRERGDMKAEPRIVKCPSCGTRNRVPAATTGVVRCAKCHADMPWVVDAGENTFDEVVQTSSVPVVVDLWAPWCGPCRTVSPLLEQMAVEYAEQAPDLALVTVDRGLDLLREVAVEHVRLAHHGPDAPHLEHQPLQDPRATCSVSRQQPAGFLSEIDHDRAGFKD